MASNCAHSTVGCKSNRNDALGIVLKVLLMTSIKSHPVLTDRTNVKGIVRWFSERLGYGFVDVENKEVLFTVQP